MKNILRIVLLLTLLFAFQATQPARAADGVVQAPCDEAAFDAAFNSVQASGGGTITFNCGGQATITLSVQKVLLADTVLDGGGQITLSGNDKTRLFFVNSGLSLTVRSLTMRDGFADVGGGLIETFGGKVQIENASLLDSQATTTGGAINCSLDNLAGEVTVDGSLLQGNSAQNGGAIYSGGCQVSIMGSSLLNNRAIPVGTDFGKGGAIYLDPQGYLFAQDTLFDQNQGYAGGALYISNGASAVLYGAALDRSLAAHGGAIHNQGSLLISGCELDRNQATEQGGGIWNFSGSINMEFSHLRRGLAQEGGGLLTYGGPVNLLAVWVDGNTASGDGGGGIYSGGGAMNVTESTISNNTASGANGDGGGILYWSDGDLGMTNVTVARNQAPNGRGGGLYHRNRSATLTHSTFSGNQAMNGRHIYQDPIAGYGVTLAASALDGEGAACGGPALTFINSNGYNFVEGTCNLLALTTDKLQAGDLGLLPLGSYGGPTLTQLPAAGSQLVDAIPPGDCSPLAGSDQRFELRPSGAGCDAGAVERQADDILARLFLPMMTR